MLSEDLRFFRRKAAVYYIILKDPYDPAYLYMDEHGNELKGEHIMQSEI